MAGDLQTRSGGRLEGDAKARDWLARWLLGTRLGRDIEVAHYPPGCSKYNPIEHRLFCHVTRCLQSVVLRTIEVARNLIARTTTTAGLQVVAQIARRTYVKGCQASAAFLKQTPIVYSDFLPQLNYTAPAWSW
jgi:hypothetical protein